MDYKPPTVTDLGSVAQQTLVTTTRQVTITKDITPDTDGAFGLGALLGPGSNPRPAI